MVVRIWRWLTIIAGARIANRNEKNLLLLGAKCDLVVDADTVMPDEDLSCKTLY